MDPLPPNGGERGVRQALVPETDGSVVMRAQCSRASVGHDWHGEQTAENRADGFNTRTGKG